MCTCHRRVASEAMAKKSAMKAKKMKKAAMAKKTKKAAVKATAKKSAMKAAMKKATAMKAMKKVAEPEKELFKQFRPVIEVGLKGKHLWRLIDVQIGDEVAEETFEQVTP